MIRVEPHQDDPRAVARIATITAMVVVAAFVASKVARDALWLSNFEVTSLPVFVGVSAVLSFPIALVTGRLMSRFGPGRLMPMFNVTSAAILLCEWAVYERAPRVAAVAVFLHVSSIGAVLVSGFWSIVNERFDARTAKRYIGRIGLGATYLTTDTLLVIVVGLQFVVALALRSLAGGIQGSIPRANADRPALSAMRLVATSRLLRNLALVVVLGAAAAAILDYALKSQIAADRGGAVRSLAIYYTATNVVTALVQIAIGRAVLGRFGVPRTVATLPAAVAAFSAFALAVPTIVATAIARGAEAVVRSSIYRSAYELLYAPLPERHKRPTKVVLDIGAERIGDLLGAHLVGALGSLTTQGSASIQSASACVPASSMR